jgi:hypothetical protein
MKIQGNPSETHLKELKPLFLYTYKANDGTEKVGVVKTATDLEAYILERKAQKVIEVYC